MIKSFYLSKSKIVLKRDIKILSDKKALYCSFGWFFPVKGKSVTYNTWHFKFDKILHEYFIVLLEDNEIISLKY